MIEKTVIELHGEQWKAYGLTKQFGLVVCGVRAGKTFLGSVWAQKKIEEYPMGNGLIAAPTNKILQQATLEGFLKLFPEYRQFYKKQEGTIELPSGGKIYVRSTDEPLGLEGMTLDWAWLDEAGMMSRVVWVVIKARVSMARGQVLITTTPYSMNWLYKEVYIPYKEGTDQDIDFFNWRSIDNPYFPKEFAEKEKARMTPVEYARRYEGKFVRLEGLVWNIDESHILKKETIEDYLKYPERTIGGIDWGYTNPSGILIIKIKDGKYYVSSEWKETQRTTTDIIQKATEFHKENFIQIWYPDPAEPDRIEEMRKSNMVTGEVNKSIPLGISKVAELLKEHKLFILDSCKELVDEISQYRYDIAKDNRDGKEIPLKVNDHLCDCLRYAIIGNEMGQNFTYQEEKDEQQRIMENRNSRKSFELL